MDIENKIAFIGRTQTNISLIQYAKKIVLRKENSEIEEQDFYALLC